MKEGGVGLSLIPPMHPEAPLGLLQVAFPAAGMLFLPRNDGFFGVPRPAGSFMRNKSVSGCDERFRVCVGRPPGVLDASQCLPGV